MELTSPKGFPSGHTLHPLWGTIRNRQNPAFSFPVAAGGVAFRNYYNAAVDSLRKAFLRVRDIDVSPLSIEVTMLANATATRSLTLSNTGDVDVD